MNAIDQKVRSLRGQLQSARMHIKLMTALTPMVHYPFVMAEYMERLKAHYEKERAAYDREAALVAEVAELHTSGAMMTVPHPSDDYWK